MEAAGPVADPPQARRRTLPACQDAEFRIDLADAIAAIPEDTEEAQREQLRDWIWAATLGNLARQSSVDEVFAGVADEPVIRDEALSHVLRLPAGPTRAVTTKQGRVIVLVDAAAVDSAEPPVLEAVDDEVLALGHTPDQVDVYGYEVVPSGEARVCRIGHYDRAQLEAPDHGYRRASVAGVADLQSFLAGGVDLLSAECTSNGLRVTGRERPRSAQAAVSVEEVASLAQPLGLHYVPPAYFGRTAALSASDLADLQRRARDLDNLFAAPDIELRLALDSSTTPKDDYVRSLLRTILRWRTESPGVSTTDLLLSYELQRGFDGKLGFSLDPIFSSALAARSVDELIAALPDFGKVEAILSTWGATHAANRLHEAELGARAADSARGWLQKAQASLRTASDADVKDILWNTVPADPPDVGAAVAGHLLRAVMSSKGRQCARYDGPLAGTATGMTWFYTDLSAKLLMLNWRGQAPEGVIPGFESVVHETGSTAACADDERPSTRLWFGARDEGYVRSGPGALRFAPTTARIFAKGSVPGKGQTETEPAALEAQFIRWWDQHYASVAAWEPQYEALNQLMKWSAVVQSANIAQNRACLGFLDSVPIGRSERLDSWVNVRPQLRLRDAVSRAGLDSSGPECMPLLSSESFKTCGNTQRLFGGVGITGKEEVSAKPIRSRPSLAGVGRVSPDADFSVAGPHQVRLARLSRSGGGELKNVEISGSADRSAFRAEIDAAHSQRGTTASVDPRAPVRSTAKIVKSVGSAELYFEQRYNDFVGAGLRASDLNLAKIHLKVERGSKGDADSLGKQVATREARGGVDFEHAAISLASEHEVEVLDGGRVAVAVGDPSRARTKTFAVMESGAGNRGPPGGTIHFLAGYSDGGPGDAGGGGHEPVSVWLARGPDAERYIAAHTKQHIAAGDPTREAVKAKLDEGDLAGAIAALDRAPTVAAAKLALDTAIARNDFTTAERILQSTTTAPRGDDFAALGLDLATQRAHVRPDSPAAASLLHLEFQAAIEERRNAMPDSNEDASIRTFADRAFVQVDYPAGHELPPSIHPVGPSLPPNEQYVSRLFSIPAELDGSRSIKGADGQVYEARRGPSPKSSSYSQRGSAARLISPRVYGVLVTRCSDSDRRLPPCHDPVALYRFTCAVTMFSRCTAPGGAAGAGVRACVSTVDQCDTDDDCAWSTPREKACLQEVEQCRAQPDDGWASPEERACLDAVRKKYGPSAAAPGP